MQASNICILSRLLTKLGRSHERTQKEDLGTDSDSVIGVYYLPDYEFSRASVLEFPWNVMCLMKMGDLLHSNMLKNAYRIYMEECRVKFVEISTYFLSVLGLDVWDIEKCMYEVISILKAPKIGYPFLCNLTGILPIFM